LNKFKFQGQEHVDDLGLNWDSFKWRNHQPDIGRFFNVDPLAEKYVYNSPYAFSENDVVSAIELEGLEKVRIKNYSRIQSAEIRNNISTKNNVLNTPVTTSNPRSSKLNQIEKSNNEITRIVTYGSEKGFPDDYMVNRLEENGISVPESVKQGEQTTITEVIDPNAEFSMELKGVSEDKNGNLTIAPLGEVNPSKEESKVNMETAKAAGLKFLEAVVEWFLTRDSPVEIPPIVLPEEQKDLN
jgi:RHS repeat-associated protein